MAEDGDTLRIVPRPPPESSSAGIVNRMRGRATSSSRPMIDYSGGDGPPLIFQTMMFDGERDMQSWRWDTEERARARLRRRLRAYLLGAAVLLGANAVSASRSGGQARHDRLRSNRRPPHCAARPRCISLTP